MLLCSHYSKAHVMTVLPMQAEAPVRPNFISETWLEPELISSLSLLEYTVSLHVFIFVGIDCTWRVETASSNVIS